MKNCCEDCNCEEKKKSPNYLKVLFYVLAIGIVLSVIGTDLFTYLSK